MGPKKKNYISIVIPLLAAGVAFLLGLWPFFVLAAPFLLIFVLRKMAEKKPAPATIVQTPALPAPATEQSVLTLAFGVLQNRITETVRCYYPTARWTWITGNAQEQFAAGNPLAIMLNGAGGYRTAIVITHELQFCGLVYQTATIPVPDSPDTAEPAPVSEPEPGNEGETDYGLLAFEWVEANLQQLNARGNEAIAQGEDGFRISAGELPHGDSWPAIRAELVRSGFKAAEVLADGIQVQIKTEQ